LGKYKEAYLMGMERSSLILEITYKESLFKADAKEKVVTFEKMEAIMKGSLETVLLMDLENSVMGMDINMKVNGKPISLMVVDKLFTMTEVDIMDNF
jgi:hypothetical protein